MKRFLSSGLSCAAGAAAILMVSTLVCELALAQATVPLAGNHPLTNLHSWHTAPPQMRLHMAAILSLRNTAPWVAVF
ncbi:MAG TPA: hypothetical protein VKV28_06910 [Candidatus Binataceae bacterium]|nr:hypothetical protein [Candidatus Binataceae bacterium]